eukprot:TRINITY_DN17007_c0_g3_i2.p1 TRINITY_DN17007_c0_g3~~TRINITY_DN17007_c0_g3_i2.p1  ORF type:complete len:524 (-),score=79.62 TRINITY_DN17007_c0_g3_i2:311-1882(-)
MRMILIHANKTNMLIVKGEAKGGSKPSNKRSFTMDANTQGILVLLLVCLPMIEPSQSQMTSSPGSPAGKAPKKTSQRKAASIVLRNLQSNKKEMNFAKAKLDLTKLKAKSSLNALFNARGSSIPFGSMSLMEPNRSSATYRASSLAKRNSLAESSKPILQTDKIQSYLISQGILFNEENIADTSVKMLLSGKLGLSVAVDESTISLLKEDKLFKLVSRSGNKDVKGILDRIKRIVDKTEQAHDDFLLKRFREDVDKKISNKDSTHLVTAFICVKQLLNELEVISKEKTELLIKALTKLFKENETSWKQLLNAFAEITENLGLNATQSTSKSKDKGERQNVLEAKILASLEYERSGRIKLKGELRALQRDVSVWILQWEKMRRSDKITQKLQSLTEVDKMCDTNEEMDDDKRVLRINIERLIQAYPGDFLADRRKETTPKDSPLRQAANSEKKVERIKINRESTLLKNYKDKAESQSIFPPIKNQEVAIQTESLKTSKEKEIESFFKNNSKVLSVHKCRTAMSG